MNQILQGQPMTIFGDGTQTRAFSFVDDVAPAIAGAIDEPKAWNEVFNIGADDPCTLNDLAARVAAAMGVEPRITYLAERHEVHDAHATHEKARRVLGARPAVALDDGLRRMAAWVREQGARSTPAFERHRDHEEPARRMELMLRMRAKRATRTERADEAARASACRGV